MMSFLAYITGLRKGTSHEKVYTELGWVPLKERRRINKLILLHKILHDAKLFPHIPILDE
jgi:hypothetical protein